MRIALNQTTGTAPSRRGGARRHRGITSMLAMVYMVLFSTLALGFYAMVTTAVAMSRNERQSVETRVATESGFEFVQYHLSQAKIDHVGPTQFMDKLHADLLARLGGTANLTATDSTVKLELDDVINFPVRIDPPNPDTYHLITLDDKGAAFRATLKPITNTVTTDQKILVHISARSGSPGNYTYRGVQAQFLRRSSTLDYGFATRGTYVQSGSSEIFGSPSGQIADVFAASATGTSSVAGKVLGGDIYTVNPNPTSVTIGAGMSVGGETDPSAIKADHVHTGVPAPEFPTVDTSKFIPYATTMYLPTMTTLTNVYIPASTSLLTPPPLIDLSGKTIRGVLYIKGPNNIRISGNTNMQGIIVTDPVPGGSITKNLLTVAGTFTATGVETLDPVAFGDLTKMGGSLMLLPGFHVTFTGSSGLSGGTVAAGQFTFTGNSSLTLEGSVIGLEDRPLTVGGSGAMTVKPSTWPGVPSGLSFKNATKGFQPVFSTFAEVPQ